MKKFKIGYVIKYFHPIKGGAEYYILSLALQAASDGHDVHVFTSSRKGKDVLKRPEEEYKGIKIHRCKTWFDFSLYLGFYPSLFFKLLKADLDVIHVSGFGFIWHDFVLIIKKLISKGTKFINTPHGPFMALSDYSFTLKIPKKIYTFIQKLFLNWLYDVVIQVNTFQWQWIVQYRISKSKIKFVSNGIVEEVINTKTSKSQLLAFIQKYNLEGKFAVSYLGRISEYKGIQHVISILPKLIDIKDDIVFLVMGRDEGYLRTLKVLAERMGVKEHIRFIENISEEEKFVALEVSKVFVFPSQWEAFGIVQLEAMSRGNVLVSTKTEGGRFLISDGDNGFLYDFGNTDQLFDILRKLVLYKTFVKEMSLKNLQRVREFSWEVIYKKQYLPILKSLSWR